MGAGWRRHARAACLTLPPECSLYTLSKLCLVLVPTYPHSPFPAPRPQTRRLPAPQPPMRRQLPTHPQLAERPAPAQNE